MNSPAEGRQIPFDTASKPQLRAFANHLGIKTTNFDTEEKLREKIRGEGYDSAHIIAFEPVTTKTAQAKAIARGDAVVELGSGKLFVHRDCLKLGRSSPRSS